MSVKKLTKWIPSAFKKINAPRQQIDVCHNVFGITDLLQQEKTNNIQLEPVMSEQYDQAVQMLKDYYLSEHAIIRAQGIDLKHDNALDEYIYSLLKQGNTIFARTDYNNIAGICVNVASSPSDPDHLRHYAFYRQNHTTKSFLNFIAKLQETPNLWDMYKVPHILEIKMLAVLPEYRRQGLATMLAKKSNDMAEAKGIDVVRMDCINPYDYKVAERVLFHCVVKYPLHHLLDAHAHGSVRVYVRPRIRDPPDADHQCAHTRQSATVLSKRTPTRDTHQNRARAELDSLVE